MMTAVNSSGNNAVVRKGGYFSVKLSEIDINFEKLVLDMSRGDVQISLTLALNNETLCNYIVPDAPSEKQLTGGGYSISNMNFGQSIVEYSFKNLDLAKQLYRSPQSYHDYVYVTKSANQYNNIQFSVPYKYKKYAVVFFSPYMGANKSVTTVQAITDVDKLDTGNMPH